MYGDHAAVKRYLAAFALLALLMALGVAVLHQRGIGSSSAQGTSTPTYLWSGEDFANAHGQHLSLGYVIVGSDRLTIQYRATGISFDSGGGIDPSGQPPTLISATADGKLLTPMEGSVGGDPHTPIVTGDFTWRWSGGNPRQIHQVVTRILGDPNANWVADLELQPPQSR
jgi:hypothetical protein